MAFHQLAQDLTAWVQFVTETLIAIGVGYNTFLGMRAKGERRRLVATQEHLSGQVANVAAKVEEVHVATNGMQGALVAAATKEGLERGVAIGVAAATEKKAG